MHNNIFSMLSLEMSRESRQFDVKERLVFSFEPIARTVKPCLFHDTV